MSSPASVGIFGTIFFAVLTILNFKKYRETKNKHFLIASICGIILTIAALSIVTSMPPYIALFLAIILIVSPILVIYDILLGGWSEMLAERVQKIQKHKNKKLTLWNFLFTYASLWWFYKKMGKFWASFIFALIQSIMSLIVFYGVSFYVLHERIIEIIIITAFTIFVLNFIQSYKALKDYELKSITKQKRDIIKK